MNAERRSFRPTVWQLVMLVMLLLGMLYILKFPSEDHDRFPAPTPVNENVNEIAP